MSTALSLKVYNGSHSIDIICNDWKKIIDRMDRMQYFQMVEFYKSYINSIEKDPDSVCFIILYEGDNPLAIFPFRKVILPCGPIKIDALISLNDSFEMPLFDFIVQKDESKHAFQMFLKELQGTPVNRWHMMSIRNVLDNSCINLALDNISRIKKIHYYSTKCYYLSTDSYDSILRDTSSNFRRQLKRSKIKLSKSGPSSFSSVSKSPELEEAYLRFLQIEGSGWKGVLKTSIEQNERRDRFYRDIIRYYSESNSCEIHELEFEDQIIACSLTITCGDTCYLLKMGYDEDFAQFSPGNLLMDYLIKRCCDSEFINELNFISNTPHLEHWKPSHYTQSNYFIFNNQLSGIFLYNCVWLFHAIKGVPLINKNVLTPLKTIFLKKISSTQERAKSKNSVK